MAEDTGLDAADETRPLLNGVSSTPEHGSRPGQRSHWRIVATMAAIVLLLTSTANLALVPTTTILEGIVCRKYYADTHLDPPEPVSDRCKVAPIQSEVAYINGWKDSLEILPGVLLAVPYGALSDRVGRKLVFLLAIFGCFMNDAWIRIVYWLHDTFPLRAVWFGGLWQAFGGGASMLTAISFVLIADVCPAEQRTTAFAWLRAANIISQMVFVPIGGAFRDPWLPMWIASGGMLLSLCLAALLLPETSPSISEDEGGDSSADNAEALVRRDAVKGGILVRAREKMANVAALGGWVLRHPRLVLVLSSFFLFQFGEGPSGTLLLQYAAKRLGWSLGETSFLISLGAGTHLFVLTVLIPMLSTFFIRRLSLHDAAKDKRLAQISGVFLVVGMVGVFFAASWFLFAAGWVVASLGLAFLIPTRSLVTGFVDQKHLGVLYTVLSVLSYGGTMMGGPIFAAAFAWGMQLGDFWMGMPFLIAAACFALCFVAVSVFRTGPEGRGLEGVGDDETERLL